MALGPQTVARLEHGLRFAAQKGCQLVVSAGYSPRHPRQPQSMAALMADWLVAHGAATPVVLEAKKFNTRGELRACEQAGFHPRVIISDPLHLERTKILVRRMWGRSKAGLIEFEPTEAVAMTSRGQKLEPIKRAFLYLPLWLQDGITFLLHETPLRKVNLSY